MPYLPSSRQPFLCPAHTIPTAGARLRARPSAGDDMSQDKCGKLLKVTNPATGQAAIVQVVVSYTRSAGLADPGWRQHGACTNDVELGWRRRCVMTGQRQGRLPTPTHWEPAAGHVWPWRAGYGPGEHAGPALHAAHDAVCALSWGQACRTQPPSNKPSPRSAAWQRAIKQERGPERPVHCHLPSATQVAFKSIDGDGAGVRDGHMMLNIQWVGRIAMN